MQNPIVASNSDLETPNKEATTAGRMSMKSFAEKFQEGFLWDDPDGVIKLIDKDIVWNFMATGERFSGLEQYRKAAEKAMAGRVHTDALHMEVTNLFWSDDQLCIEYLNRC